MLQVELPTSKLFWLRVIALLFTCIAFSTASRGAELLHYGLLADWCIFCWAFSFAFTLLILLVELFGLQTRAPGLIWSNFTVTVASYAALFCLSASKTCTYLFLYQGPKEVCGYCIVSTVFSYLAVTAYVVEVRIFRARPEEEKGYMSTYLGHSKVVETFIVCLIFVILSYLPYDQFSELRWCMAVYCICFIVSMAVVVLCVCESTGSLSKRFSKFLFIYEVLAVIMYLSAIIIWALQFDGQIERYLVSNSPASAYLYRVFLITLCVTTGLNFVFYLIDLAHSAKQLFVST